MFFEIYEKLGEGKYAKEIHDAFEAKCSSLLDGFTKVKKLINHLEDFSYLDSV